MSAEAARRVLKHFQGVASGDTLLRIIRQTRLPPSEVPQIVGVDPLYDLTQQFVQVVKQRLVEQLDPWLEQCETVNAGQVQNFASSLRQDYAAGRAALETVWSNGQTERQVNRLKCIKRQMYGRANFDLLRLKVLYASGFT
jgi:hypothetical protein